ncbi:hypothetical protein F4678DRAFT_474917 [Xylaria arbuscula]|nr:hypothetical protein F4678DRAFT_474917 [Xylaria arbuscula]
MDVLIFTFLLALVTASAEGLGPLIIDGTSIPDELDTESLEIITNAQQHPNVTRAAFFKPLELAKNSVGYPTLGDLEWAWRINVSDFVPSDALADLTSYGSDETVDTHIVTTSYDFSWSSPENLTSELNSSIASFCLTVATSLTDLPANVTNAYTEQDTNSTSCVPALGQACVDAILATEKFEGDPVYGNCRAPSQLWSELPQCQNTLGYVYNVSHGFTLLTGSRGFSNRTSQNATADFKNGGGWFGYISSPVNGSGSNEYYTAINRLHIAMINPLLAYDGDFDSGFSQDPQLLCMRVNATMLPTKDTNGDGVTWTSEAVLESAGNSVQRTLDRSSLLLQLISLCFVVAVNLYDIS